MNILDSGVPRQSAEVKFKEMGPEKVSGTFLIRKAILACWRQRAEGAHLAVKVTANSKRDWD